ncbi:uncharacterized protein PG986_010669 [Apiospora aurea]|uniref:Uncharacterized protein n=1 Tax=Apiospora aurea TaxID=335848 RepID=A0ABR1Q2W5_9PEZI
MLLTRDEGSAGARSCEFSGDITRRWLSAGGPPSCWPSGGGAPGTPGTAARTSAARKPSHQCHRNHAQAGTLEEWELGRTEVPGPDHQPLAAAVVLGPGPRAFQPSCEGASAVHDRPAIAFAEAFEEGSDREETFLARPALAASVHGPGQLAWTRGLGQARGMTPGENRWVPWEDVAFPSA